MCWKFGSDYEMVKIVFKIIPKHDLNHLNEFWLYENQVLDWLMI